MSGKLSAASLQQASEIMHSEAQDGRVSSSSLRSFPRGGAIVRGTRGRGVERERERGGGREGGSDTVLPPRSGFQHQVTWTR